MPNSHPILRRALAPLLAALLACGATLVRAVERGDLAFVDVNLVPMDRARVLAHQTVLVHDGAITLIGPARRTKPPAHATRIEGHGSAYLMPGLADLHTHVSEDADLALYLARGVTTILHLGGAEQRLVGHIRGDVERGEVPGPQAWFSLLVDGSDAFGLFHVADAESARAAVQLAKINGYDFIKVYNNVTPDEFAALVDAGRAAGLPVIGHGVRSVGLPDALFRGQTMVAHAEEFVYTAFEHDRSDARVAAVVADVKRSGAYVMPTLATFEAIAAMWGKPDVVTGWLHQPQAQYLSPTVVEHWNRTFYAHRKSADLSQSLAFQRRFTLALQRAGVPLLTGTDSPEIPGMFPGDSLHEEIRNLVASGLTPYEALSAATRNAGEFLHASHPERPAFGVVAVGARADLLLAATDPLKDPTTLRTPLGVAAAGRWYDRAALDALIAERRERYAHPFDAK